MSGQKFEYHPEAVAEASEAHRWYAERSPQAAKRFLAELTRARASVTETPSAWGQYFHGTRCFRFRRFPFGLVYAENGDLIIGLAVAHFKRKPGYWRNRLDD